MSSRVTIRAGINGRPMRGPDKVAALLLAMGKPLAGRMLKHFDAVELRQITRSASDLGAVPVATVETLVEEFTGQFARGVDLVGSAGEAAQLLAGILPPEQIADIMSDVLGNSNQSMWDRLSNVPEQAFAAYLQKEHPQTAALVLSKVSSACAAKVLSLMTRRLRNEMMRRMLGVKPVTEKTMRLLESTLNEDLLMTVARNTGADPNARMADIINKMEREQIDDVLQSIAEVKPKTAEVLKGLLFTFEDILKLSSQARMIVFDKVPTERIVLALKGTDAAFKEAVLGAMAARARRMVESELANSGPASQRDVTKARRAVADLILELADKGEIEINASDDNATLD